MIYKMSYNSSGCVEMLAIADSPMPQKSFVLRLSGKCITEYYEGDVDFNDNIRMKDGVGYMTKKRIPLNGNGIVIKFFSDGTPSTYKTIVRNRLFGRQIEWDEKGNVISDVDLDIPKPWSGAPKSQEGQQQLAKDQPVAKEAKLASPMRVWTTADGKSKTTARIIAKTDETVTLENEAGKRMEVKIERLIESDQKYITTWQQPEK